ncbi:MAG: hypothetical protein NZ828_05725 [Alphaproteobacteria bacterium]|nr:hypothetical protein [Alphaproteobacteria bacterium]
MIEKSKEFYGWAESVYNAGCALIHLSVSHGMSINDKIGDVRINGVYESEIVDYLKQFHDFPDIQSPHIKDICPYLPKVLKKISDNTNYYLEKLL